MKNYNQLKGNSLNSLNFLEHRMATEKIYRLVLIYSIPTIISMFVNAIYTVVDRYWIGKLSFDATLAVAGVGISMSISNILLAIGQLIGIGSAACISIKLGKDNKDSAEEVLNNSIILSILLSILLVIFGFLFLEPFLYIMGASKNTICYALEYSRVIVNGSIFFILSFVLNHCIRATGKPKIFATTQLIGAIINIILDPIFLFVFNLGVKGVGYATIISQFISLLCILYYYISNNSLLKINILYFKLKYETCKSIIFIGISPFFISVSSTFVMAVVNNNLKYYGGIELGNGDIAIGSMAIINTILVLFYVPSIGINQGTQPIIGFNYGSGNFKRMKEAYKWGAIYCAIICFIGSMMIFFFGENIVKIFTKDQMLISITLKGMKIYLSTLVLIGLQINASNLFQAIGRAKIALLLSILRQILLIIPLYILLPKFLGLNGIWIAGPIADIISIIVTSIFIIREFKLISN